MLPIIEMYKLVFDMSQHTFKEQFEPSDGWRKQGSHDEKLRRWQHESLETVGTWFGKLKDMDRAEGVS